jgi:hypothetical protein
MAEIDRASCASFRIHETDMEKQNRLIAKEFVRRIPPGTWVWDSEDRRDYGLTVGGKGVYVDPTSGHVVVENVNGKRGSNGAFPTSTAISKD